MLPLCIQPVPSGQVRGLNGGIRLGAVTRIGQMNGGY
jgi:hypothetical protein